MGCAIARGIVAGSSIIPRRRTSYVIYYEGVYEFGIPGPSEHMYGCHHKGIRFIRELTFTLMSDIGLF